VAKRARKKEDANVLTTFAKKEGGGIGREVPRPKTQRKRDRLKRNREKGSTQLSEMQG